MLSLSNFTSIATNDPTQTTRKRDLTSAEDSNATVDIVKRQQTTHSSLDQPDTPYSSPKCEHSLVEDDNTTVQVTKRQKQVIQSVKDHADIVEQVDKAVATSSPNKTVCPCQKHKGAVSRLTWLILGVGVDNIFK